MAAVASPSAGNGDYWGPGGFQQWSGAPRPLRPAANALDPEAGDRLVALSERLSGVRLPV